MAAKKISAKKVPAKSQAGGGPKSTATKATAKGGSSKKPPPLTAPVFPYTNKPHSLRKFLQLVPNKPKPQKIDSALMKSWGFRDTNDMSIVRVLKAIDLINASNEPTELYARFMAHQGGAASIAPQIRTVYASLFNAAHKPYAESSEALQNLFNIHSGGSKVTLDFQIQTFKALAESTAFDQDSSSTPQPHSAGDHSQKETPKVPSGATAPSVHIDLHIHLPENKSRRDYEAMIEDIGRYIYGRDEASRVSS